jgi:hypothetical protein
MQFSEMKTEVLRRLEESGSKWATTAQAGTAINDGYEELSDVTEWNESSFSVSKTDSTMYYDLSSTSVYSAAATNPVITVRRVYNNETSRWLLPGDYQRFDTTRRQWEASEGEPQYFWMRGHWWLGLHPRPDATSGTVTVYASVQPTALSADADTPGFPREYHLALVEYGVYDLLCQDNEFGKAERYLRRFLEKQEGLRRFVMQRAVKDRVGSLG